MATSTPNTQTQISLEMISSVVPVILVSLAVGRGFQLHATNVKGLPTA